MANLEKIAKFGTKSAYKKDDIICMQGDPGHNMYIVLKGNFNVYINSMTDFPIKVADIAPGQFFGEMSMLDDVPRSATVIAGEDSLAMAVSKEDFKHLVNEDGEIALSIMRTLSGRIRALNDKLEKNQTSFDLEGSTDSSVSDTNASLRPEGQKSYGIIKPPKYDLFTDERLNKCPVCKRDFTVKMPNFSKLAQKNSTTRKDQRVSYDNFDMLWYNIWICPSCNYAEYYSSFHRIREEAVKALKSSGYMNKAERPSKSKEGTIDFVIDSYYLSMLCNAMGAKNPETEAKTWLRLYWLYGDAKDNERRLYAAEKALAAYEKIAYKLEPDYKLQAYTIMAELAIALNNLPKAALLYEQVCNETKKNNALLYEQAFSRISELKSARMKSN